LSLVTVEMVMQTTFSEPNSFGQVVAVVEVLDIRQTFMVLEMVDVAAAVVVVPSENKSQRNHDKEVPVQMG
jgi:hypothetical protein